MARGKEACKTLRYSLIQLANRMNETTIVGQNRLFKEAKPISVSDYIEERVFKNATIIKTICLTTLDF